MPLLFLDTPPPLPPKVGTVEAAVWMDFSQKMKVETPWLFKDDNVLAYQLLMSSYVKGGVSAAC